MARAHCPVPSAACVRARRDRPAARRPPENAQPVGRLGKRRTLAKPWIVRFRSDGARRVTPISAGVLAPSMSTDGGPGPPTPGLSIVIPTLHRRESLLETL